MKTAYNIRSHYIFVIHFQLYITVRKICHLNLQRRLKGPRKKGNLRFLNNGLWRMILSSKGNIISLKWRPYVLTHIIDVQILFMKFQCIWLPNIWLLRFSSICNRLNLLAYLEASIRCSWGYSMFHQGRNSLSDNCKGLMDHS